MNQVDAAARAYGLDAGEGEARWWLGGLATVKATGKETDGRYTLIEIFEPEGEGPLHVHHREDEGFFIIEGELTFQIGEETIKASPGSFVFGPKGVPPTPTPWTRGRRSSCSYSRLRVLRSVSTQPASRPRSAPCHLSQRARLAKKRWSSSEPLFASTDARFSSSTRAGRWRAQALSLRSLSTR